MSSLMIYDTIYIYTKSIYKEFGVSKNIIIPIPCQPENAGVTRLRQLTTRDYGRISGFLEKIIRSAPSGALLLHFRRLDFEGVGVTF